ncbi:MAG: serine hydrolase [Leptolyngbyaceae cyanobacterium]
MAENNHPLNNGNSPFRRYEPPAPTAAQNGNVSPLLPPPLSPPGGSSGTTSRGARRRQRNARSRWRQWIGTSSSASEATPRSPAQRPAPAPRAASGTPRPQPAAGRSRIIDPLPRRPQSRQFSDSTVSQQANPANQSASRSDVRSRPAAPPRRARAGKPPSAASKVTPLRRQPVWTSPEPPAQSSHQPRRGKPRRPARRAPRPVLYGIRLLILGTGIAAITGTVLSSRSPQEAARNEPTTASDTVSSTAHSGVASSTTLTQPLPLAEELVALETDLVALESMTPGLTQSVFFYDLDTGNYIDLNGTAAVSAASTLKVPVLVAFLQAIDAGTIRLDQAVTLREDLVAGGSGELQTQAIGEQYTALEIATEMIVNSDNTATNMVIDLLGGVDTLNQQFQAWGLESTVMRNLLPDLDGTNTTSATDLVRIMALVDQGDLLGPRSRDRFFSIMQRTYNRTLIPDGLADESALAYNKTGDIGTALADIALVDVANGNRYILGVLVDRPFNDGRASELIRRISGRVHEEMSQPVSPTGSGSSSEQTPDSTSETPAVPDDAAVPTSEDATPEDDAAEPYAEPGAPISNPELPPG